MSSQQMSLTSWVCSSASAAPPKQTPTDIVQQALRKPLRDSWHTAVALQKEAADGLVEYATAQGVDMSQEALGLGAGALLRCGSRNRAAISPLIKCGTGKDCNWAKAWIITELARQIPENAAAAPVVRAAELCILASKEENSALVEAAYQEALRLSPLDISYALYI